MEQAQDKVKQSTFTRYSFIIDKHIIPMIGTLKASELTAERLSEFLAEKLVSGRLDGKGGLSPKTVRDMGVLIKSALKQADVEYDLYTDICKVRLPKVKRVRIDVFTEAEARAITDQALKDGSLASLPVLLAINTGLRLGELCALRVSDFDFMNNTVSINRSVQRVKLDGRWKTIVTTPKSETSCRNVPVPEKVAEIIKRFIPTYRASDELYLFTGKRDEPLCPRTCQHRFESLLKRCGVRRRGFHTLRHTYATRCIEKDVNVKSLSEVLGHADVLTTMRYYAHASMDYKKRSAELVSTMNDIELPRACA